MQLRKDTGHPSDTYLGRVNCVYYVFGMKVFGELELFTLRRLNEE